MADGSPGLTEVGTDARLGEVMVESPIAAKVGSRFAATASFLYPAAARVDEPLTPAPRRRSMVEPPPGRQAAAASPSAQCRARGPLADHLHWAKAEGGRQPAAETADGSPLPEEMGADSPPGEVLVELRIVAAAGSQSEAKG
jgi:hypothetical protein